MTLKKGPYGYYVQFGEAPEGEKPRRSSIPKGMDPGSLSLERALELLALPRLIGRHPEDGEPVEAGIGRFGPFVKHGKTYANIRDAEEVFTIGMNRAVELIALKAQRGSAARGGEAAPRARRASRRRRGRPLRGPLRALREVGEGQRHPPEGDRPRGGDPRRGPRPDRRQGPEEARPRPQGRRQARQGQGRGEEGGEGGAKKAAKPRAAKVAASE